MNDYHKNKEFVNRNDFWKSLTKKKRILKSEKK